MKKRFKYSILGVVLLLVCSIFYIYLHRPYMSIIIRYKDVPPVLQRFPRAKVDAYYRGCYIGRVSKVKLSDDQKFIVFYLDIYYKNLRLPRNVEIYLDSEDLYGARHLTIIYPKNPSSLLISDGDVVDGTGFYERIDKYLARDLKSGKLARIETNLMYATYLLKNTLSRNNLKTVGQDTDLILNDLKEILGDPQVKYSLKSTIKASSRSLNDVNQLMENKELRETISKAPKSIDKAINNLESINDNLPGVNETIAKANISIQKVNKSVSITNSFLAPTSRNLDVINRKVPYIPPELLGNADKMLIEADCLTKELSDILSKRFLLFRLMFGTPASSFKKCTQGNACNRGCPDNK